MKRILLLITIVLLFSSCQELFTTSLGSPLARNKKDLYAKLSLKEINDMRTGQDLPKDDALAVLQRLENLAGESSNQDADLGLAAVALVGSALGLEELLPTILDSDVSKDGVINIDGLDELINKTVGDMDQLSAISTALVSITPEPGSQAWDSFIEEADEADLVLASSSIFLATAQASGSVTDYVKDFDPADEDMSPAESLAVQMLVDKFDEAPENILSIILRDFLPEGFGET